MVRRTADSFAVVPHRIVGLDVGHGCVAAAVAGWASSLWRRDGQRVLSVRTESREPAATRSSRCCARGVAPPTCGNVCAGIMDFDIGSWPVGVDCAGVSEDM